MHLSAVGPVLLELLKLHGKAQYLFCTQRGILRGKQILDCSGLDGLLLAAHDVLHEVDGDALVAGQVEATVDSQEATQTQSDQSVSTYLKISFLPLYLAASSLALIF